MRRANLRANLIRLACVQHFCRKHAGIGFDAKAISLAGLGKKTRGAAQSVAAHFGLGSIRIEDPHARIGLARCFDQNQPVAANAAAPIAQTAREVFKV